MPWTPALTISGSPPPRASQYLLLCLAASALALVSSRQDAALDAVIGAVFGQFMALFVPAVIAVKAAVSVGWIEAVISALGLCAELWLLKSWRFSPPS
jgi:hypothetical protein